MEQFALCVAEHHYRLGKCRIEYFQTKQALEKYRSGLDQSVTTWLLGEAEPKRRVRT